MQAVFSQNAEMVEFLLEQNEEVNEVVRRFCLEEIVLFWFLNIPLLLLFLCKNAYIHIPDN